MHKFIKYRHAVTTVMIIVLLVIILAKCMNHDTIESGTIKNAAGEKFAGSATCASCHKSIYDNHLNTAHYHTSALASRKEIKGSFDSGKTGFLMMIAGWWQWK